MSTLEHPEVDTRLRILAAAERLFRQIGYQKTTVADIARVLRMSPANVYRYFDSKKAIHEGVALRLMGEVEAAADVIASKSWPAADRLRALLSTINAMNTERYVGDSNLHEMVAIAMEESWDVCLAHMEVMTSIVGRVVNDGVKSGEFRAGDVETMAKCVVTGMLRFFHPQMISQCADKPGPTLEQMIEFLVISLTGHAGDAPGVQPE